MLAGDKLAGIKHVADAADGVFALFSGRLRVEFGGELLRVEGFLFRLHDKLHDRFFEFVVAEHRRLPSQNAERFIR